jgi:predicted ATPase
MPPAARPRRSRPSSAGRWPSWGSSCPSWPPWRGRLLVIGTYRDVEVDRRHPLSGTLAELYRQPATSYLSLSGLDQGDVGRFIAGVTGTDPALDLVAAVHGQTEGNPFFVSELVRLLAAEQRLEAGGLREAGVPEGIRHVIGRRLNRLSDAANASLAAASVQGRDFDLDVVARATGAPAGDVLDDLEEAMEARLVVEVEGRPGRFRFAHALVHETLYEELPARERRRLHDRMGAALVELRGDDFEGYLAELAHHFSQAARPGQAGQAVAYTRQAGDRAMKVLAYEEAASHYQRDLRALDLQPRPVEAERCDLLLALAEARMAAGAVDQLEVELLEEALVVLGEADSALRARVLARLPRRCNPRPARSGGTGSAGTPWPWPGAWATPPPWPPCSTSATWPPGGRTTWRSGWPRPPRWSSWPRPPATR